MSDLYDIPAHAVFEASAGTGKTYTVEQLVLRFLKKGIALDQILIVTYTEKAAAELQDRLRVAIAAEYDRAETSETMNAALERYDDAQIFTIHAFCLRILQQYPFDHGQNARAQMTRDDEVMSACLREVQRSEWPKAFEKELTSLLAVARFNLDNGGAAWDEKVSRIAASFRPDCGHRLVPDQNIEPAELRELREFFTAEFDAIAKLVGPLTSSLDAHPLYVGYGKLEFNSKWRDAWRRDYLVPLLLWATDPESRTDPIASFAGMVNQSGDDAFEILTRKVSQLDAACRHLPAIVTKLDVMRARLAQIEYVLARSTVQSLQQRMEKFKQQRGLQSFDDFLTRVARALTPEHNPRANDLVQALRKRYHVAIVDEFQDTDPLQWNIFKRIFVEGGDRQLILVGDPKQAIYSFRNADVDTYIQAREELKSLGTPVRPLNVSYRASASLLRGLNTLFRDGSFFVGGSIAFSDVSPAPDGMRPEAELDRTDRKALTVLRFRDGTGAAQASRQLAGFIAGEVARLLTPMDDKPLLRYAHKGAVHDLRADGIAILLFKRFDSRWIEEQLRARGIHYTFYKKTGIWQSDEAVHLNLVLKALARADQPELFRQMLLTRFFSVRPECVSAYEHSAQSESLHRLFLRWRELCDRRRWAELFRSILEDTGTLAHEIRAFDGSRRIANYRYITQELARSAYERGLSLLDLVELLQQKRLTSGEDESGLQPLETERPAVKLMTIHASKGLEFPVVFLAGGFTSPTSKHFYKFHDNGQLVFDLNTSDKTSRDRARSEELEESHRLLYVALTRAMLKLYIPSLPKGRLNGAVPTILSPAITAAKLDQSEDCGMIDAQAVAPDATAAPVPLAASASTKIKISGPLMPGLDLGRLAARRIELQSFSRLVQHTIPAFEIPVLERPPRADDDDQSPDTAEPRILAKDDLPSGASAGDVLHAIVENIDFKSVRTAKTKGDLLKDGSATRLLIEKCLRIFMPEVANDKAIFARRSERVAELIWNTLRMPLTPLGGTTLSELESGQRIHELEFHMPFNLPGRALPDEVTSADGFMTGFMDLVFTHKKRFYLLDWKSNSLPSYSAAAIERDMTARNYHFQYAIYLQALRRWLASLKKSPDLIGGVFYIYLRGMNLSDPTRGLYFRAPATADFDERKLAESLSQQASHRGRRHD
jgi:exodeoxyribonuclease V beta subunit